jgi:hypothetical protein
LRWSLHRGDTEPVLGWYSAGLGHRVPSFTLLGQGCCAADMRLVALLTFRESENFSAPSRSRQAVSLEASVAALVTAPDSQSEGR